MLLRAVRDGAASEPHPPAATYVGISIQLMRESAPELRGQLQSAQNCPGTARMRSFDGRESDHGTPRCLGAYIEIQARQQAYVQST